ncbi:MAG: lysylphosphatidylglycerol synthase domain-containing protein [Thermodesulfobacteriota bacterium]
MASNLLDRLKNPALRRAAGWVWIGLVIFFLFWYLRRHWSEFRDQAWHLDPWWTIGAVAWAWLRRLLAAWRWALIAQPGPGRLDRATAWEEMRIYFLSSLAAYLPGSVWYMASRIQQSRRIGHGVVKTSLGLVFETGLLLWSGLTVGLLAQDRLWPAGSTFLGLLAALLVILTALALHPRIVNYILGHIFRLIRRPLIRLEASWTWGLGVWILSLGLWLAWGLSLFSLLKALDPAVSWASLLDITGAYALAWSLGFLTIWAPSGLGVREGFLFVLLAPYAAVPVAMTAALASRLVTVSEDLFWAALALLSGGGRTADLK